MSSSVVVRIDDRLRHVGALLAAGEWPEREQALKAYKPHRVAEAARRYFARHRTHPAVGAAQALAGNGGGLGQLCTCALYANWPPRLPVGDFVYAARPEAFWVETQADWHQAEKEARAVLARADLGKFLEHLFGPQTRRLVVMPNLLFPALQTVPAMSGREVVVCLPPPLAWGASHPWRYDERPDEVLAKLTESFARCLFESGLPAAQSALQPLADLFAAAAAVVLLRQAEGRAAGDQFLLMETKTRGLPGLPAAVDALEPVLAARRAGKCGGLMDDLAQLAAHL